MSGLTYVAVALLGSFYLVSTSSLVWAGFGVEAVLDLVICQRSKDLVEESSWGTTEWQYI